jgi:hypothetical protein
MKERLLFDRVDIHRDYLAIDKAVQNAVSIFAYSTDASLSIFDRAMMIAQKAPDLLFIELFIEHRLFHIIIIAIRNFFRHLSVNYSMKKVDTTTAVVLHSIL